MIDEYQENQYTGVSRNPLVREGFNLRERLNVYAGAAIGALTPIIGLKCILSSGYGNYSLGAETAAWLSSLAINFSPLLFGVFPIPFYTACVGGIIGGVEAGRIKTAREDKEKLRRIRTEILPSSLEELTENSGGNIN